MLVTVTPALAGADQSQSIKHDQQHFTLVGIVTDVSSNTIAIQALNDRFAGRDFRVVKAWESEAREMGERGPLALVPLMPLMGGANTVQRPTCSPRTVFSRYGYSCFLSRPCPNHIERPASSHPDSTS